MRRVVATSGFRPDGRQGKEDDKQLEWLWAKLSERKWDSVCLYCFRCNSCKRFKAHYDTD